MSAHRRARKRAYNAAVERALQEQDDDPIAAWSYDAPAVEAARQIAEYVSDREATMLRGLADIGHPDGFDPVAEAERFLAGGS